MNRRFKYNIIYAVFMVAILIVFLFIEVNDMVEILLGGMAIILTSIFTYSNRYAISRRRRKKDD